MIRRLAVLVLCLGPATPAWPQAAEPPRGPDALIESTMAACTAESSAMTAPGDESGRDLVEARRTWRAIAVEVLRASIAEPWSSQAAFVTGMRMVDARSAFDRAITRALARPRSDADVVRLAAAVRTFTERGAAPIHGLRADDPALVDAAMRACLDGLPEALAPFATDDGRDQPDADLWPGTGDPRGSSAAVQRLLAALGTGQDGAPWTARARAGALQLREAASIAAFRPEAEALAEAALGTIALLRALPSVAWLDAATVRLLTDRCTDALAALDRPQDRRRCRAELAGLSRRGRLLEDLGVICAGRGGRPPMGVDAAARCVALVLADDHAEQRMQAAALLAQAMRVEADRLPGSMPSLMGAILRRSSKDRTLLIGWLADGGGQAVPSESLTAVRRAADDLTLLARVAGAVERATALGARAQQAALRAAERSADGLKGERTREQATSALVALDRRIGGWVRFAGESELRVASSAVAAVAGPSAERLAARIDRTRTQWAGSLGRPEHAEVASMELLERLMRQISRSAALGLDDAAVLSTSASLSRWAAWCPHADGVAVTLAPLRPRLALASLAAAEGQWDECSRLLEAIDQDLPIAEFAATVAARIAPSLPVAEPSIPATIRSIMSPVHEGSWLAADRARLATLARAWRELRHATTAGDAERAQAASAMATQVARDLLGSLAAIDPDTVTP